MDDFIKFITIPKYSKKENIVSFNIEISLLVPLEKILILSTKSKWVIDRLPPTEITFGISFK